MNFIKKTLLLLFFIVIHHPLSAQENYCSIVNTSFKNLEKLYYRVYYNMGVIWIHAGNVSFSVNQKQLEGKEVFHIVGDGKTNKSYEWFYKVRDKYETYIDTKTLLPLKFIRDVNEGGYTIYSDVSFNHATGKAITGDTSYAIPKCVQDVVSAIYYSRNVDYSKYSVGDKIPFSMFLDDKVYNLYIRYMGKEQIKTKYGVFNTIKFNPLLIEGTIFKGGEKMMVWVSDDENKIPVRIESPIMVGSIKVDLMGYEHIRNPLKGLIRLN